MWAAARLDGRAIFNRQSGSVGLRRRRGEIVMGGLAVLGQRAFDRQAKDKGASLADLAREQDVAPVFAEDLSAHRQAEPGPARPLGTHEGPEHVGLLLGRNAGTIVDDVE